MTEALSISTDLNRAAALARAFEKAPELVTEEMTGAIWEAEMLTERETKERTPVGIGGGGGLKGSIAAHEPVRLADNIIGKVGTPLNYAVPVEIGTKPHWPPIQPLVDWAEHKFGLPRDEARTAGFLIARKIARVGTKGARMFHDAWNANRAQVQRIFERAQKRILETVGDRA